jgi:phytoene desaturase
MADLLTLERVDPMYRACFDDGSELRVRHGREAMTEEVRATCGPGEAASFERFCAWLERLYRVEMPHFIERDYDSPLDLLRPLQPAIDLVRLGAFRRLANVVARYFTDERLQRLFTFQSMYAGLAPYEALGIYAVIT